MPGIFIYILLCAGTRPPQNLGEDVDYDSYQESSRVVANGGTVGQSYYYNYMFGGYRIMKSLRIFLVVILVSLLFPYTLFAQDAQNVKETVKIYYPNGDWLLLLIQNAQK